MEKGQVLNLEPIACSLKNNNPESLNAFGVAFTLTYLLPFMHAFAHRIREKLWHQAGAFQSRGILR